MKKILGLISVILCSATVALFTSCLNSDGDPGMTPERINQCINLMSGNYTSSSNKAFFYNDTISGENKTDSLEDISAYVYSRDTTLIVNGISNRVLAKTLKDESLKKILEKAPQGNLKIKFLPFNEIGSQVWFFVYPYDYTFPAINIGDKTHKVQVKFYVPSSGVFNHANQKKEIAISLIPSAIYIDDKKAESIYDGKSEEEKIGKSEILIHTKM